jgi:hypothetical protein
MRALILSAFFLFVFSSPLHSQHADGHQEHQEHPAFPHFRVAAFIGHTSVPVAHTSQRVFIPSWGIDLEYWINPKWGLGLHNDIEMEPLIIEQSEEDTEYKYLFVFTLDGLYKPWKDLVLQAGGGIEVVQEESFAIFRLGVEYEFEIGNHWDLFPSLIYDTSLGSFHAITIGFGVGKRF